MKTPLSERLFLVPRNLSWWIWLATALSLAAGLGGYPLGFRAAVLISVVQAVVYDFKEVSGFTFPVQVRFAYTALLILCQASSLEWLYWLPAAGTFAFVLSGYCPMARVLSLLPWNRTEPITQDLIRRTFLARPVPGEVRHGLPAADCGGSCALEGRIANLSARKQGISLSKIKQKT
jgi:hypothetical protein